MIWDAATILDCLQQSTTLNVKVQSVLFHCDGGREAIRPKIKQTRMILWGYNTTVVCQICILEVGAQLPVAPPLVNRLTDRTAVKKNAYPV